jgi:demethylmenaquinone methyltransferase/2-methoxy-6-polyprenyl-1,4-benzoquinol methylase
MTDSSGSPRPPAGAPHPPLTRYYAGEAQRSDWVRGLFDRTAADYDRIERLAGLGSGSRYRREALLRAGLAQGHRVLDVGVGTGLVARQAAGIVGDPSLVVGIDPSPGMLGSASLPRGVVLVEAHAERIPFPDGSFDFVCMGYALRHVSDLPLVFAEFFRVMRPGARLCMLEITPPRSRLGRALLKAYLRSVVPWLARVAARRADTPMLWSYYWDTIEACVPPESVLRMLESAGFAGVHRHVELGIFSEYRAARRRHESID